MGRTARCSWEGQPWLALSLRCVLEREGALVRTKVGRRTRVFGVQLKFSFRLACLPLSIPLRMYGRRAFLWLCPRPRSAGCRRRLQPCQTRFRLVPACRAGGCGKPAVGHQAVHCSATHQHCTTESAGGGGGQKAAFEQAGLGGWGPLSDNGVACSAPGAALPTHHPRTVPLSPRRCGPTAPRRRRTSAAASPPLGWPPPPGQPPTGAAAAQRRPPAARAQLWRAQPYQPAGHARLRALARCPGRGRGGGGCRGACRRQVGGRWGWCDFCRTMRAVRPFCSGKLPRPKHCISFAGNSRSRNGSGGNRISPPVPSNLPTTSACCALGCRRSGLTTRWSRWTPAATTGAGPPPPEGQPSSPQPRKRRPQPLPLLRRRRRLRRRPRRRRRCCG